MFGKLICWWQRKHKRGKLLRKDTVPVVMNGESVGVIYNVYACPRCGHETRYKA